MTEPNRELIEACRILFPSTRDPRISPRRGDMFSGHGGRVTIDATMPIDAERLLILVRFNNMPQTWWMSRWNEWAKHATVLRRAEDNFEGGMHDAFVESRRLERAAPPKKAEKKAEV